MFAKAIFIFFAFSRIHYIFKQTRKFLTTVGQLTKFFELMKYGTANLKKNCLEIPMNH